MTYSPTYYLSCIRDLAVPLREIYAKNDFIGKLEKVTGIKQESRQDFMNFLDDIIRNNGKNLSGQDLIDKIDLLELNNNTSFETRETIKTYFRDILMAHLAREVPSRVASMSITTNTNHHYQVASSSGIGADHINDTNSDSLAVFNGSSLMVMVSDGIGGKSGSPKQILQTGKLAANLLVNFFGANADQIDKPLRFVFRSPKEIVDQITIHTRLEDLFDLLVPKGEGDNDKLRQIQTQYFSQGGKKPDQFLVDLPELIFPNDIADYFQEIKNHIGSFDSAEALLQDFGIARFDDRVINTLNLYKTFPDYLIEAMKRDPRISETPGIISSGATSAVLLDLGDKLAVVSVGDIIPWGYNRRGITLLKTNNLNLDRARETLRFHATDCVGSTRTRNQSTTDPEYAILDGNLMVSIFDRHEYEGIVLMSDALMREGVIKDKLLPKLASIRRSNPQTLISRLLQGKPSIDDDCTIVAIRLQPQSQSFYQWFCSWTRY